MTSSPNGRASGGRRLLLLGVLSAIIVSAAGVWAAWPASASVTNNTCTDDQGVDTTLACPQNTLLVDADSGSAGIQATRNVTVGQTVSVAVQQTTAGSGVGGMEMQLAPGNPAILAIDPVNLGDPNNTPSLAGGGLTGLGCGSPGHVGSGPTGNAHITCTAASGAPLQTNNVNLFTLNVTCMTAGTTAVHLVSGVNTTHSAGVVQAADDAIFGTSELATAADFIPIVLTDASIICQANQGATFTPTNTPTVTGTATATATTGAGGGGNATNTPTPDIKTATPIGGIPTETPTVGTPAATNTVPAGGGGQTQTPGGGAGGGGNAPGGGPGGVITLPDTGSGSSGSSFAPYLWLVLGLFATASLGGAIYVRTRKDAA